MWTAPKAWRFSRVRQNLPAGGWVGFQTNGQLLDAKQADTIVEAGIDRVCLSSDAVSTEIFQRIRKGGNRQAVDSAVAALAAQRIAEAQKDRDHGPERVAQVIARA